MSKSGSVMSLVRDHFRQAATSFDSIYDEASPLQRVARPAMFDRMDSARRLVGRFDQPRVLDVGCGSGRVAEELLKAGAGQYVGVDFSEPMVALASERLKPFGAQVDLKVGDFIQADLGEPYDVIVAVGFWDYIAEPEPFVRKMFELTAPGGVSYGSFPRWTWHKGPYRKMRYEVVNSCPIFNFTERELRFLFRSAGYARVELDKRSDGYFCYAWRDSA